MKVLIVCNNYYGKGNGLAASARTTTKYLKEAGIDVRVISAVNPDPQGSQPDYPLQQFHFPIFQPLIEKQTYCFAQADQKVIEKAVEWADIMHLEDPFPLQNRVAKEARKRGKPCVGTFHMYPENITSTLFMRHWKLGNHLLLQWFNRMNYRHCSHIQCPTQNVVDRLTANHFKGRLHLIPNGMVNTDRCEGNIKLETDPYLILAIGRYSVEKGLPTLLKAMKYTKYADRIQLCFAGKGPCEGKLRRAATKLVKEGILKHEPWFRYCSQQELGELSSQAYLYIHCAFIEVEGLSCLEALRHATVPVIAQGRYTATSQFSLHEQSVFPIFDAKALAQRIDWWIEHPEERERMGAKYAESVKSYAIQDSIKALINMYQAALDEQKR